MLFVLVLFVGVVVDVGQAVNRRIALQVVADAGAYTGASIMAVGMNQLAVWNRVMQYAWVLFTNPPVFNPMWYAFMIHDTSCDAADFEEGLYYGAMGLLHGIYWAENVGYGFLAASEANRVSVYNAGDMFPGEDLGYAESALGQGVRAGHPLTGIAPSEEVPDGSDLKAIAFMNIPIVNFVTVRSDSSNWYVCEDLFPPRFEVRDRQYPVWYRRTGGPTSFVWVVTAPQTYALMFDTWFGGPKIIPEMTAVAVAKPIGGNIEEGRDEYISKMIPVATVMTRFFGGDFPALVLSEVGRAGQVSDDQYDRAWRIVTH